MLIAPDKVIKREKNVPEIDEKLGLYGIWNVMNINQKQNAKWISMSASDDIESCFLVI